MRSNRRVIFSSWVELDKIEVALEAPLKLNFYMIAKKRKVDLSKDVKVTFYTCRKFSAN